MSKRIIYTDEPIEIGRRVGREILPTHGGARVGAGRPPSGNQPITLRLPTKLVAVMRRDAKRAGQTLSDFVASRLTNSPTRSRDPRPLTQPSRAAERRAGSFRGQIQGDVSGSAVRGRDEKPTRVRGSGGGGIDPTRPRSRKS